MEIYVLIGIFILIAASMSPKNKTIFYVFCFLFSLVGFLRSQNVGTDCLGYSSAFRSITFDPQTWNRILPFEPGFNVLCAFFKQYVSFTPMTLWGLISVIYTFGLAKFFQKYTSNINIALLLFYLLGTYMLSFNIMRQSFAFGLLAFVFAFINIEKMQKRDYIKLIAMIVACAILFHPTMYILLIVPLVSFVLSRWTIPKRLLYIVIIISFLCFYFNIAINHIMEITDRLGMEGKLINYAIRNAQFEEDSGYSLLKVSLISIWTVYLIRISPSKPDIFLVLFVAGVVFLNLFGGLVVEFARIFEILNVFGIIYMARMWTVNKNYQQVYLHRIATLCYGIILFANILIKNYGGIVPYEFRF